MIRNGGWERYCIWEHSARVRELYARRCRLEEEEMTCAAQAAELLVSRVLPGDTLLDVGCGSGYFFHSLKKRGIEAEYYGIDAAPSLIDIGRKHMPAFGLSADRLQIMRIEDLDGEVEHVVCMNVLSNIDNYYRPLERILKCARKTVILRESCKDEAEYRYVEDRYLDNGCDLKVHVNAYNLREMMKFVESYGFTATHVLDCRSGGKTENVIGYPHYWNFLVGDKRSDAPAT